MFCDQALFRSFLMGQNHRWPSHLYFGKTIEKPSKSMVNLGKNIQWWWSGGSKTIEKPLKAMVPRIKTLPSHRLGQITIVEVYYQLSFPGWWSSTTNWFPATEIDKCPPSQNLIESGIMMVKLLCYVISWCCLMIFFYKALMEKLFSEGQER